MTKYPEIFAALAAPFDPSEVKGRKQAGREFHYITARTAMNRLDDVLGPEGWWDNFQQAENSVLCRLTIRLPDGSTLTKSDAGGYAGMADQGDDDKSGYSDAFKRACVKFGVARYLYRDGVPTFSAGPPPDWPPPGKGEAYDDDLSPRPREETPAPAKPARKFPYARQLIASSVATVIGLFDEELERAGWGDKDRRAARTFVVEQQALNELVTRATSPHVALIDPRAVLKENGSRDPRKSWEQLQKLYEREPGRVEVTLHAYLDKKLDEARDLARTGEWVK